MTPLVASCATMRRDAVDHAITILGILEMKMPERVVDVWRNQPNEKHTWAFVYYCKRQGDHVSTRRNHDGTLTLWVRQHRLRADDRRQFPSS